ncbi:MAG: hypothetical protein M0017_01290 [Desulfobacteraceae bacterium]|nr:hypothetical protein [Desulfobacteraceae bacterium]
MRGKLTRYKPGATIRTHLLVAAAIWSLVGAMLMVRGLLGLAAPDRSLFGLAGVAAGTLKSRLVLDRTARRNIRRLLACENGMCLGAVYTARMWGLILLMIAGGRLLWAFGPARVAGLVYVAIGWALLLSSRLIWRQWKTI